MNFIHRLVLTEKAQSSFAYQAQTYFLPEDFHLLCLRNVMLY
jgi:hypothetical protein